MLSFACEFPVRNPDTSAFIGAVRRWLEGSPHTAFKHEDLDEISPEGHSLCVVGNERLEALIANDVERGTAGFRHTVVDGAIEWRTTVVFSRSSEDCWLSVRTARESAQATTSLPRGKKPLLVRTLLSALGGGLDAELYCQDKPHYLKINDLGMAARLLNGDSDNHLPVVYVSCGFLGHPHVRVEPLAKVLGGMAHVLVEPDRSFSRALQSDVGSRNAYGGSIGIYWPHGDSFKLLVDPYATREIDARHDVVDKVLRSLLNRRPLTRCTWSRAEADVASDVFRKLRDSGSQEINDYVAVFDSELQAKDRQIEDAESEIQKLTARLRQMDTQRADFETFLKIDNEQEFFEGEFANIIKEGIFGAVESAQNGSRRQHILTAFHLSLNTSDVARAKRDELKKLLRGYTSMTKVIRDGLIKLGFSIAEDRKHYKLTYMQDERYGFTLPKTGSDHRGGMNAVSDIAKRIY